MTVPQPLTVKYLRYFEAPSMSSSGAMFGLWLRLLYEFWGFCVNGTDDLKHPGGFPTGSASDIHMTGAINMPTNWESGSTVLIYSNSDGITLEGMPWFTGSNFTADMVGKWLTVWKSGSSSGDDSIYKITQLFPTGALTSSVIGVDLNMGGTPFTGSLKPAFTARADVNYRVIDYSSSDVNTSYFDHHYIVMQMNGAPFVNPGQVNAGVRLRLGSLRTQFFTSDFSVRGVAIKMIPSGNYIGTGSADGITGGNSYQGRVGLVGALTNIGEFGPNSGNASDWNNGGAGTQCINIIGAQDFFTLFSKGAFASSGCGFHVEIPQRLYPYDKDPNPMIAMGIGYDMYTTFTDGYGYGHGWHMIVGNGTPLRGWAAIKHQTGDTYNNNAYAGIPFVCGQCLQSLGNGLYNNIWFNPFTNKFFLSDAVWGTDASGSEHTLARCRIRRVRFIAPIIQTMQRLGDQGEWLHVKNGILWPWDNAVLPASIFKQGF